MSNPATISPVLMPGTSQATAGSVSPNIVNIIWDDEACVWVAISDDIPLALESSSLDVLIERIRVAAPEMMQLNQKPIAPLHLRVAAERLLTWGRSPALVGNDG